MDQKKGFSFETFLKNPQNNALSNMWGTPQPEPESDEFFKRPKKKKNRNYIEQYVSKVISFSTEYTTTNWSANQLIGPPKHFPNYGDSVNAWCSKNYGVKEFLELEFEKPILIQEVTIYVTLCPNPISRISIKKFNEWVCVSENKPVNQMGFGGITNNNLKSLAFSPKIRKTNFLTNQIRIDIDCTGFTYWTEIDAVKIGGKIKQGPPECSYMGSVIKKIFDTGIHSDVSFLVRGKEIKAHKNILSIRSDYFKELFKITPHKSYVIEEEFEIFHLMLDFIYSNICVIKKEQIIPLCILSKKYKLLSLENYVGDYFDEIIEDDNCIQLLAECEKMECMVLVGRCLDYITVNYKDIMSRKDFENVSKHNILKICKNLSKNK